MNYTSTSLLAYARCVLRGLGCDENESDVVADHLVKANLTGHDSHGIGMLPMYAMQVKDGNLIPNQTPDLKAPTGAVTVVDAKLGFGHRMALLALDHAMETIATHKVAVLALRNSGHVSRVGTYSEYCAAKGFVSIHMVNVVGHAPLVAPFGAREPGFSTNPVSMAMPVEGKARPLLDMATSKVAFGKVRVAHNRGQSMAPGCLVDGEGVETCDPQPMAENRQGALSAFGEHKGSGLGVFVELLAGALCSEHTVASMPYQPNGVVNNMFSIILDPQAFDSAEAIAERTMGFYEFIKSREHAKGVDAVLMPGEPEMASTEERLKHGIPVDDETIRQIAEVSGLFGIDSGELSAILQIAG